MIRVAISRSRRVVLLSPTLRRGLTTIGIRKEDPARVWERRAPLTPEAVASLVGGGQDVTVEVEECGRRCFPDDDYRHAGATLVPSLTPSVDLVLGIKEPPVPAVLALQAADPGKKRKYMVFSHTHKGQPYNVPLLSAFLDQHKSQTLIDYELLTAPSPNQEGDLRRVAAFGWYAGAVGAGEGLSMTGLALLKCGIATPLLCLPRPYTFPDLVAYKAALRACGDQIRSAPALKSGGPIMIGLTGAGNVSTGARDMLDAMGVEWVTPDQLSALCGEKEIYACYIPASAYLVKIGGGTYDRADYRARPDEYRSVFASKIAPHLTTLINGAGWQDGYPRIMSNRDQDSLLGKPGAGLQKLVAVQDVACDLMGGLEFVDRHTTIDDPFFVGPGGVLISSTDILPTELPKDASTYFSSKILPYVKHLVSPRQSSCQLEETIQRATIVQDGQIQSKHEWLMPNVEKWRSGQKNAKEKPKPTLPASSNPSKPTSALAPKKKKVLLLGSGLVAGPAVEVFSSRRDISLGIASNNVKEAGALAARFGSDIETLSLDVSDTAELGRAVSTADVVVRAKGVLLLGECGLDPGIDSMAAMRILSRVKRENKRVTSFISWCGGLPEPSASSVPFGYKFSWSPKAVLTAAGNDARYKLDGRVESVDGKDLLRRHFPKVELWKGLALEGVANRDAIPYAEKYGLGEVDGLQSLFRGTLRYQGFSRLLESFRQIGLLSLDPMKLVERSWSAFLIQTLRMSLGLRIESRMKEDHIQSVLRDLLGAQAEETFESLQWLSMLPSSTPTPVPPHLNTPIDILAYILSQKLAYGPNERDSCLLHHAFEIIPHRSYSASQLGDRETTQRVTASLLHYGTPTASSMSITVGKTLAFAALRVVDGDVKGRGVKGPYEREVWEGVLDRLEEAGVEVQEHWT